MYRNPELLNYVYTDNPDLAHKPTLVLIHGLFGDLNNLGMIGRHFQDRFNILRVDLANHGQSFYRNSVDYYEMAADVKKVCDHLGLTKVIPIGHSMGGKVAMRFAFNFPEIVEALVVLDMAPVVYGKRGHDEVFWALNQVRLHDCQTRDQAKEVLAANLKDPGVIAFLTKSFTVEEPHKFVFNVPVLEEEYSRVGQWTESVTQIPTAFIYGGASLYVSPERRSAIAPQFLHSKLYEVAGASHWLHAEQPRKVFEYITDFFEQEHILERDLSAYESSYY